MSKRRKTAARRSGDPRRRAVAPLLHAVGEVQEVWPAAAPAPAPVWPADELDQVDVVELQREAMRDLRRLPGQRRALERRQSRLVAQVRAGGASWVEIGRALEISPQAAQKRYGRR